MAACRLELEAFLEMRAHELRGGGEEADHSAPQAVASASEALLQAPPSCYHTPALDSRVRGPRLYAGVNPRGVAW